MNIDEAITLLRRANEWRRGAEIPQPNPHLLGAAIDTVLAEVERLRAQGDRQVAVCPHCAKIVGPELAARCAASQKKE